MPFPKFNRKITFKKKREKLGVFRGPDNRIIPNQILNPKLRGIKASTNLKVFELENKIKQLSLKKPKDYLKKIEQLKFKINVAKGRVEFKEYLIKEKRDIQRKKRTSKN